MERIPIKIKRLGHNPDLPLPGYETEGSSGMDVRAAVESPVTLNPGEVKLIPTGFAVSIPPGYEGQVRPRSGLALRHGIGMVNSPGTIDSDYRGEVSIIMINWGQMPFTINRGDRIAQMVIGKVYRADLVDVNDSSLDATIRGAGGFGHSGIG
ncbi:MAG: dUTP diphosphatase [Deltaproteobacteria bacterium]|nr:dUTP diphosphatase [Deltaproteobacteria bacterium]